MVQFKSILCIKYIHFSPTVDYKKFIVNTDTGTKVVWENTTTLWTVTYNVFAIDNGRPRRGDFFPVQIKYDPSCDVTASLVANDLGEIHFRAPKMTNYNDTKFRYGKLRDYLKCYQPFITIISYCRYPANIPGLFNVASTSFDVESKLKRRQVFITRHK